MKEFKQVAQIYKELAQLYIVNRKKPAYKTGNLYNKVGSYNNPDRMVTIRKSRARTKFKLETPSVNISLSFAPPGAKYGEYVHQGKSKMEARPFAEEAAKSPTVKRAINNAVKGVVDKDVLPAIRKMMDKAFVRMLSK